MSSRPSGGTGNNQIEVPYNDLMLDLKQIGANELNLNDKRYLLRPAL
jgi:hypothetical protein